MAVSIDEPIQCLQPIISARHLVQCQEPLGSQIAAVPIATRACANMAVLTKLLLRQARKFLDCQI